MAIVAFVPHRRRSDATDRVKAAIAHLEDHGHQARVPASDARATGLDGWAVHEDKLGEGLDLAVAVGGDGTMLRCIDLVSQAGVPVLGVHVGHLGYLTQVQPAELESALDRFLAGDYALEERMTLEVSHAGEGPRTCTALNEVVVQRAAGSHVVRLEVRVGDEQVKTYAADGLIVATPTGSTAYNLSARGPIVEPALQALLLTAVSPHELFDRTLVLGPEREVRIELLDTRPAELVVDGNHVATMQPGDSVLCRRGRMPARLVTFQGRDFWGVLKAKFGLVDR